MMIILDEFCPISVHTETERGINKKFALKTNTKCIKPNFFGYTLSPA